jgi:putative ABC transport system permease protein
MLQTVRRAVRVLLRVPGLTATAVLTVGLGVGAGTALFSVVKAVLLNPLPYPHPGQIAWLSEVGHGRMRIAMGNFVDWREQNRSFTTLAAYGDGPVIVGGGATPERTHAASVTEDFFAVLGVPPLLGRTFSPAEHKYHAAITAILGYGLWQRAYGADPAILGRTIRVMGLPATVIGVMPQGFAFPTGTELWVNSEAFMDADSRTAHNDWAIGRLRPGVTIEQARQDISAIARRLKQLYPGPFQARDASTGLLQSYLTGEVRPALLALFGAAGFLLLLVSVNVANLLLVRTVNRSRELAIRTALGASRSRLFGDLMIESLLLALAGGALGLAIAFWSMDLLRILLPANLPRLADVHIDRGVIVFAFAASVLAGFLVGTLPGWLGSRLNLNSVLKAGARSHTSGRRTRRVQAALVISEVALSLVLLAGAGLLVASFAKLRAVDPGFRPDHILVANLVFSDRDPSVVRHK